RYHSLHATPDQVTGGFEVTAVTADPAARGGARRNGAGRPGDVVMAIEDPAAGRWAVQFHPESILTAAGDAGMQIIGNRLRLCRARPALSPNAPAPVRWWAFLGGIAVTCSLAVAW